MKLKKEFFSRNADLVARDLIGKILVVKKSGKILKARIVETEAYFGIDDPASWARFGKRKDNEHMWSSAGTVLIKNVHKYFMLNFVTSEIDNPQAVLIRAVEPLNFDGNCSGPGLLTLCLGINKSFNGKSVLNSDEIWIEDSEDKHEIEKSFRIGVVKDLENHLRFFVKENKFVSKYKNKN